jgi:hypothetical protein
MSDQESFSCFYVSPAGCDRWSGRSPQPDQTAGDGPFATLQKAVEKSREEGKQNKKIILRGGSYYNTSVVLKEEDSGLTVEAMPGEAPVLYGGQRISGWRKEKNSELWFAEVPQVASGEWNFRMLQVNGRFCQRSRLPETGFYTYLTEFKVRWMNSCNGGWERKPTREELTTIQYDPGDLGAWLNIRNAELTVYHKWDESLAGLAHHDSASRTLILSNPCGHPPGAFGTNKYAVWNVREGMTRPGQWYLDRNEGRVYYWPVKEESMEEAEVVAPTGYTIFSFTEKVENVTIKGLTLSVTGTPLIAGDFGAIRMPGAVQSAEGLENCLFTDLTVKNTGGHGVKLLNACRNTRVENCEISNTGAGGIVFMNNSKEQPDNNIETVAFCVPLEVRDVKPDCSITNNLVRNTGLLYPSAIAVSTRCCNVIHNEISDTSYTGIACGGGNATIEYNHVSRVVQALNDGAAIYVTFCKNGTVRGNVIRDIQEAAGTENLKNAIYLDEMCEGWQIEGNLVINCTQPEFNHIASNNILKNNVFLSDGPIILNFRRCDRFVLEKNILLAKGKIVLQGNKEAIVRFTDNIFYSASGEYEEHYMERYELREITPLKEQEGIKRADPLIINTDACVYSFREDSPAWGLGILPVDVRTAGRLPV